MRPAEIEGISLRHSVICEQIDKVDLRFQPKTKSGLHSHKLPKTRDRTVCPRATFFDWLKRIDNKHGRSIRENKYGALLWNEDITIPAKRGQISLRLKKLLNLMSIKGKQIYSFRHSAAAQLVVMCLDETLLNTYTGHARNSKPTNEYYVFAERQKITKQQRNFLKLAAKWNVIQFHVLNKCEVVGYNIHTPQLPKWDYWSLEDQVGELVMMVSNKLVGMRCQQSFMGGYAHAVR
ncbi:MAG: hypothetical protein EZS28_028429 [Streblomastix strix]|uniref:Tyr recombinase domain-containing protein n=1 Tax=Streblomastix strix TaxID=222440 RepID=A0A5J4V0W8_9EUKA|nr:MAG: hypothetical protein EZS28_028429 [Streblomastix strix]